ncbi:hypothetical protein ACFV0A_09915, partial [Streptomyces sp. NPDC059552]
MTETTAYETILVERKGRTALLTLNRPRALNALNLRVMNEVVAATEALDRAPDMRGQRRPPPPPPTGPAAHPPPPPPPAGPAARGRALGMCALRRSLAGAWSRRYCLPARNPAHGRP